MPRLDPSKVVIETYDFWDSAPWNRPVDDRPIDHARTAWLHSEVNRNVRCSPGNPLDPAGSALHRVHHVNDWNNRWWNPTIRRIPLSGTIHVNSRNPDAQVFFIDEVARKYYELSAFGPSWWPAPWRADSIVTWDLAQPWDATTKWIAGGGLPIWPLIPTVEQLEDGHVGHQLVWSSVGLNSAGKSCGYSSEPPVGYARRTDGECERHPLRAGEILRLNPDRAPIPKNQQEATLIDTLIEYGAVVNDKTDWEAGNNIRMPGDPRFKVNLALMSSMFDVVAA